jgi:HSP20 family molecular chaperone IbpA
MRNKTQRNLTLTHKNNQNNIFNIITIMFQTKYSRLMSPLSITHARVSLPAVYPAFGYVTREWSRKLATAMRTTKPIDQDSSPTALTSMTSSPSLSTFFHDVDELFDRNSLFPTSSWPHDSMSHFWRQVDLMDDMRRKRILSKNTYLPNCNIHADDDKVQVVLDLPGVQLKDVNVNIENDRQLHINGNRKTKSEDGSTSEMTFDKKFNFGADTIDSSKVVANLADGVLRVSLPKFPSTKNVKKVDVINGSEESEC